MAGPVTAAHDGRHPVPGLETQQTISAEIAEISARTRRVRQDASAPTAVDYPPYRSSALRHPDKTLLVVDPEGVELASPCFGERDVNAADADLTVGHRGDPVGERMVVTGRVLDGAGRPVRHQLVEIWQANAGGRYHHERDQHAAALDPHFTGAGRCLTDADGVYRFTTIRPGPYPWRNHHNAWRPAHIHFSVFGTAFTQRLVTQMYFPGDDAMLALDPIAQAVIDPRARARLVAAYDHEISQHEWATGYRWDIVLTGAASTPTEADLLDTGGAA